MNNTILNVTDLWITYIDEYRKFDAVKRVNFSLNKGESIGIIGESGSGKTSIANAIMQILPNTAKTKGSIKYLNNEITNLPYKKAQDILWSEIAIIFQNSLDVLNPVLNVGKQISEVIIEHNKTSKKDALDKSKEFLELVRLPNETINLYPHELSGGMRQRVLIAMALACSPKLLIADELTSALDTKTKTEILNLLDNLQKKFKFSLILISHELDTIARLTDKVLVLYKGELIEEGITSKVLDIQYHPYSRGLINSSSAINIYKDLWGIPAAKDNINTGCPFYSRCTQRVDKCSHENVTLKEIEINRKIACHQNGILNVLSCNSIYKTFHNKEGSVDACINCSFDIRHGEFISIVGKSGSGKTTVASIVSGVLKKDKGEVTFNGNNIRPYRMGSKTRSIQFIFQDPFSSINENFTVMDTVSEPLTINNLYKNNPIEIVKKYLNSVELEASDEFLNRKIYTLSGGQRQRIALARALVMKPTLLVADEICSMLDKSTEANILRLLKKLQNLEGFAMIYITHNLSTALKISDRILVMNEGRIVEQGNAVKVIRNPKHPYTKELIDFNNKNEELLY